MLVSMRREREREREYIESEVEAPSLSSHDCGRERGGPLIIMFAHQHPIDATIRKQHVCITDDEVQILILAAECPMELTSHMSSYRSACSAILAIYTRDSLEPLAEKRSMLALAIL
jgi:hypothetical protein